VIAIVAAMPRPRSRCQHLPSPSGARSRRSPPPAIREQTGGLRFHVVIRFDRKAPFFASLDCLHPLGMMSPMAMPSGPVPPVAPLELAKRRARCPDAPDPVPLHRPAADSELRGSRALRGVIGQGVLRIEIGQSYALQDVAQAASRPRGAPARSAHRPDPVTDRGPCVARLRRDAASRTARC